jgi:uncharacterized protein YbaA (DUF1428 family)
MKYVDGFLTPVHGTKREVYRDLARRAASVLKECGAIRVVECWLDESPDASVDFYHASEARPSLGGPLNAASSGFRAAVGASRDEAVVFSWVEWADKASRDTGMSRAMNDPRMQFTEDEPVFEGSRLIASGFIPILDL